jgi:cell division protein FtsL
MKNQKKLLIISFAVAIFAILIVAGGYLYTQTKTYQTRQSEIDLLQARIKTLEHINQELEQSK